jgi:hypothetical protein
MGSYFFIKCFPFTILTAHSATVRPVKGTVRALEKEEQPMAHVYVHTYIDTVHGVVLIHFSGDRTRFGAFIRNKTIFNLAVTGMQVIPPKDKLWDPIAKTWNIHTDVWAKLQGYYLPAPELYELVYYTTRAQWNRFASGVPVATVDNNGFTQAQSDADAAASFFGNQAFNQAVYLTARETSDREEFISLLGLNSWGSFDALNAAAAKKLYRSAAIKHHPDKNAGDGSRMSKLNELSGIYGTR